MFIQFLFIHNVLSKTPISVFLILFQRTLPKKSIIEIALNTMNDVCLLISLNARPSCNSCIIQRQILRQHFETNYLSRYIKHCYGMFHTFSQDHIKNFRSFWALKIIKINQILRYLDVMCKVTILVYVLGIFIAICIVLQGLIKNRNALLS